MRVAMVTGEYPPMEGGVGAFTHQLALAIRAAGHEVHVLTTGDGAAGDEDGLIVHRCVRRWNMPGVAAARRRLRALAPDVVNLQYEPAAFGMRGAITLSREILMLGLDVPLVVTFHDLLPPYLFPKAGPLRRKSVLHLARSANGVIVTNHEDLEALSGVREGRLSPPVHRIPIGSNISATPAPGFDRERWRGTHGFAPGDLVVGFFGFLNRTKGIETLLDAAAELASEGAPLHLLFIGGRTGTSDVTNAAYAQEVDARIEALGLSPRVQATGFAASEEVSAALKSIDVCALPYREGANLRHGTLHAALAHGCPIVTTRAASPVPELADGRALMLIRPGDAAALARALRTLAIDRSARDALSRGATALATRFTWPAIAAETLTFYESLRPAPSVRPTAF